MRPNSNLNRLLLAFAGVLAISTILSGCSGGGACCSGYGGARGYAYQSTSGTTVFVSASSQPPAGYAPVPSGTTVSIERYPSLFTQTANNGFYYIPDIPIGAIVLVVETDSLTYRVSIPIICDRITEGGGHSEGGA